MDGKNQSDAEHMIHIGDPIAAYLAYNPQEIQEIVPVEIEINNYIEGVDMFHADAVKYVNVKKVQNSNVLVVKSVKDPKKMRNQIVDYIKTAFKYVKIGN